MVFRKKTKKKGRGCIISRPRRIAPLPIQQHIIVEEAEDPFDIFEPFNEPAVNFAPEQLAAMLAFIDQGGNGSANPTYSENISYMSDSSGHGLQQKLNSIRTMQDNLHRRTLRKV